MVNLKLHPLSDVDIIRFCDLLCGKNLTTKNAMSAKSAKKKRKGTLLSIPLHRKSANINVRLFI